MTIGEAAGFKTLFVDVMKQGRFIFTLKYKYCPLFKLDMNDIYNKVIEKRPSLQGQKLDLYVD